MSDQNKNYRPADKKKGERNEYVKGKDGMIHTVITLDKKGNEICRWVSEDKIEDPKKE